MREYRPPPEFTLAWRKTTHNDPQKVPRDHVKDAHVSTAYTEACSVSVVTSLKMSRNSRFASKHLHVAAAHREKTKKTRIYIFGSVNARDFRDTPVNSIERLRPFVSPEYLPPLSFAATQRRRSSPV